MQHNHYEEAMGTQVHAMLVAGDISVARLIFNELTKRRISFEVKFHPDNDEKSMAFFVNAEDMNLIMEVTQSVKQHVEAAEEAEKNEAADVDASAADAVFNVLKNVKG